MKKINLILTGAMMISAIAIIITGCAITQTVADKNGSQLWGENCIRCHNAPPSDEYSGAQWETIGMHMKMRANLTDAETNKIVAFLQAGQ